MAKTITAFGKTQTVYKWSKEVGIHHSTIYNRVWRLGWPPEKALTPKNGCLRYNRLRRMSVGRRRKKVRQLFDNGMSIERIAEKFGISTSTVWRDLRSVGRGIEHQRTARRRAVQRLIGKMSQSEMARKLGVADSTIHCDIAAIMRDPGRLAPDIDEMCDCGQAATRVEEIRVGKRTNEKLALCDDCYQLFLEVEQR